MVEIRRQHKESSVVHQKDKKKVGYILKEQKSTNKLKASTRVGTETGFKISQLSLLIFLLLPGRGGNIGAVRNASSLYLPYLTY